jgi:hypothetical protein
MIDMCGVNQQRNIVAREAIKNIDKSGQNTLVGFFYKSAIKEKVLPNKYMESLCIKKTRTRRGKPPSPTLLPRADT